MSKSLNYTDFLLKEKLNKNFPKTPCIKNNNYKEEKIRINNTKSRSGSMSKNKTGNSNSTKKYKIYSNSILEQDNHKTNDYLYKNFCSKNILNINSACNNGFSNKNNNSIGNIKEFNYFLSNNNYNYNNISSNNFYSKKINDILNYDNLTKPNNNIKSKTDANNINYINKTHSLIHNYSETNNNNSKYQVQTTKNTKNFSSKKRISNKKPFLPKSKKSNEKNKNMGKPISLLENSKNKKGINNYNYNNTNNQIYNNININRTQFNNLNVLNSNHFLKRNFLSNITYTNDNIYNNNIKPSYKNDHSPISMKYQISFINKKSQKVKKSIKKSQSQSQFNYKKKRDIDSKNKSNSKSGKKRNSKSKFNTGILSGSYKGNVSKKRIRNKNSNININNINNFNKNILNYNLIRNSSQKKKHNINIKYPVEESKAMLYYNNYDKLYNNDSNYLLNDLSEEYNKDPLFKEIKNLWDELGGVNHEYQNMFLHLTKNYRNKNTIFGNEINEISLILNYLKKLNKDIHNRNDIINKIKKLNENNNINEIKNLLLSLRLISIDVINDYILFLKEISYDTIMNKFDINKIKNLNKKYINEMKKDTDFLKDNNFLNKIFYFSTDDPFLICPSLPKENNKKDNKYIALPINNDIFQKINKCQYILLKEKICEILNYKNKSTFNSMIINPKDNYFNNISNNCMIGYSNTNANTNLNNEGTNISQLNISNNKNNMKKIVNKYNYYKCNDFFINNSNNENKKKEINKCQNERNNNSQNINNIQNIPKFSHKFDSKKQEKDISVEKNNNINSLDKTLYIKPYNPNKDSSLSSLYKSYLSSVNDNIKQSFNINNDIFYYSTIGIYPKILLFKDIKSNVKGICTLSFNENMNLTKKTLTITSISCSNEYKISQILLNLIEFCKNKEIIFDSIEINLYYIKKEDGKFILDKELENEIKTEAKFKWVRLENDGEKRKIKYHYIPNNIITNKENSILNNINNNLFDVNCNKCAISLNNYVFIKYYQQIGNNNLSMSEHAQLFFIINVLKKFFLLNNNDDEKDIEIILNNLKGIKLKKIIRILSEYNNVLETNKNDFKQDYTENEKYNIELLNTFLEIIEKNNNVNDKENFLCLNFCNIFTNFSNIIKIEIDGYEYNIISMNDFIIEVFNINVDENNDEFDEENINNFNIYDNNIGNTYEENDFNKEKVKDKDKEVLYFTKSESENISFIFYELKADYNEKDEKYIRLLFNKVLKKILIKDSEEPIKSYKRICIPSFSYKKRYIKDGDKNINEKDDILNIIEYNILDCNESFDFCIENILCDDIKFSFPLNKNINDKEEIKIIKNDFLISVINNDLILDYHLPSMNCYYINKDNWIKVKK